MLLTKSIKVKWHGNNRVWYEEKGYKYTKRGDEFEVSPLEIPNTQLLDYEIESKCDYCNSDKIIKISLSKYINNLKRNNDLFLCADCENQKQYSEYEGIKLGRLTIIKYLGYYKVNTKLKQHWFECECECGNTSIKTYNYLFHNNVQLKSCGCWNIERTIGFNKETKTGFTNEYYTKDGEYYIKIIRNNQVQETIVDEEMFKYLQIKNRKLSIDCRGYAFITQEDTYGKQMFIHNLVIFGEDYYDKNMDILVDHINNKNVLDNRKSNIRPANDSENNCNRKKGSNNTTGIKGFTIRKPKDQNIPQLSVRIEKDYKRIGKLFPFNIKGLQNAILWNLKIRKEMHGEFTNYGFNMTDKTTEQIVEEQSKIFISNLNKNDLHIFNNN